MSVTNKMVCDGSNITVNHTTIKGDGNNITGDHNKIIGDGNNIDGDHNKVSGDGNNVNGDHNKVYGDGNNIEGKHNKGDGDGNNMINHSSRTRTSSDMYISMLNSINDMFEPIGSDYTDPNPTASTNHCSSEIYDHEDYDDGAYFYGNDYYHPTTVEIKKGKLIEKLAEETQPEGERRYNLGSIELNDEDYKILEERMDRFFEILDA